MISIVLACRNEEKHIAGCVRSILGQARVPDEMELIVADGMSDDRTREVLSEIAATDPRVRVVDNPGRIAATGLNAAIRAARGQIILRMDAHTEYAPDYVRRCVEVLEETGADNVGGPARTRATTYMQGAIAAAYNSPYSVGGARFHDVDYEGWLDTVTYGCWRREIFDRIGLFDEELVRNQDDEFNLRTVRAGGRIWQSPSIRSWYSPRGSLRALFAQYRQYGYWKVRVIQKHRLPASIRHLVPGAFVLALGGLGLAAPFSAVAAVGLATDPRRVWGRSLGGFVGDRPPRRLALSRRVAGGVRLLSCELWDRVHAWDPGLGGAETVARGFVHRADPPRRLRGRAGRGRPPGTSPVTREENVPRRLLRRRLDLRQFWRRPSLAKGTGAQPPSHVSFSRLRPEVVAIGLPRRSSP